MKFRCKFQRPYRNDDPGADGTGDESIDPGATGAELSQPVDGGEQVAAAETKPASMLDAMFPKATETPEEKAAAEQRERDEKGRFAAKAPVDPNAPVDPTKKPPVDPAELTKMPEGLTPKAQERFQALANTNKELSGKLEAVSSLVGGNLDAVAPMLQSVQALQQTFQEHGVRREQFEQGMEVIGMINRGDLKAAKEVLQEQLRLISLATGEPVGAVDTLAGFPDLREAVDNLQMSEAHALEVARARTVEAGRKHADQRNKQKQDQERDQQETQQAAQQAVQQGQLAVDKFCKAQMSSDLDYAKIEPLLLKEIQGGLLQDVPPNAWAGIVEKTYRLIKQTSATARQGNTTTVLRPTGGEAPAAVPKSGFEAMWGKPAPASM